MSCLGSDQAQSYVVIFKGTTMALATQLQHMVFVCTTALNFSDFQTVKETVGLLSLEAAYQCEDH